MNEPERAKIIWDEFNKKKIKRLSDQEIKLRYKRIMNKRK
jgi:hypothetical protein